MLKRLLRNKLTNNNNFYYLQVILNLLMLNVNTLQEFKKLA